MEDRRQTRRERRAEAIRERRLGRQDRAGQQRRQRLLTRLAIGAIALVVVAGVAYVVVSALQERERRQEPSGVERFDDLIGGHTQEQVDYEQIPPVGGMHAPIWQNCGFYGAPINDENGVHALEHGAVWITYRPDLPGEQIEALRDLTDEEPFLLVSPYPELPAPVVASAWGRQLAFDSATDPEVKQFVTAFERGPQTPEPGATCTGGTSATQ